jgi:hypothetical protein
MFKKKELNVTVKPDCSNVSLDWQNSSYCSKHPFNGGGFVIPSAMGN